MPIKDDTEVLIVKRARVLTDVVKWGVRAKHENLRFTRTEVEKIWMNPVINGRETFTEAGEAIEAVA